MTDTISEEHTAAESNTSAGRLTLIGGAVGTVVGLRRSKRAAVMGGIIGGSIGYLAGKASRGQAGGGSFESAEEPVVVTVDDTDPSADADETEAATDDSNSGADQQGDED